MTAFRIFRRLSELLDVLIASPADGEVLTYSSAAGKWENQAGGGGSAGTASVIGPFQVAYDAVGLTGPGVVLHTFTTDTLVISAIVFASTPWTGANPITLEVTAGADATTPANNAAIWTASDLTDGNTQATYTRWPWVANLTNASIVSAAGVLGADAFGVAGMTAGVAQVYALVAEVTP